jgi:hypothetical protein
VTTLALRRQGQALIDLLNRAEVPVRAVAIQYHCLEGMTIRAVKFCLLRQGETIMYHKW